ncbi:unnamed protein product [Porites lobata]|uniref:Uncharacterized protein n=1 Tax=Porites lobata TaxID=104759 RepID=A0ABN8N4L3_9CNID|nr:unnamed protein product [Porites lobata]
MGSWISNQGGMSEEERKRRQNLEELLHKMKYSLNVTASTHYLAAAHYRQVDTYLQYASYITGVLGTSGSVGSRLAWNVLATKSPRLSAIFIASASVTALLFTVAVNVRQFPIPNLPSTLQQLNFKAGVECQYLERKVQLFAESDVWNSSIAWDTLASRYENLLKEKKEINSRIQTEEWAHRKALEKRKKRKKEMRQEKKELQDEMLTGP